MPVTTSVLDVLYLERIKPSMYLENHYMVQIGGLLENSKDLAWVSGGTCCETLWFQNERNEVNISAVIIVKMKASEAVGVAYYILKHKVDHTTLALDMGNLEKKRPSIWLVHMSTASNRRKDKSRLLSDGR
ncbi:hypothetical protein PGT21_012835 [Puccinia graminis f. sp. tritici]|uniref:Uncharacterized protein n=1 Tax=Puccinia graminis f. sp. tritici TaxID=56615 RepID=A0A5B0P5E8_PUCGR|nr:hypothetical protein PGT21_012835 [Puccinia graminis f. sp. tritici]